MRLWAGFFLAVGLCCASPVQAADLEGFSDALEHLADLTRAADRARSAFDEAVRGGNEYSRYDRDWREREAELERERIRTMARITGVSESRLRDLRREGNGWERIARMYDVDPRRFGYGLSSADPDRDLWRGTPPGLAKKGGIPPGLAKKEGIPPGQAKKMSNQGPKGAHKESKNKHKK